MAKAYPKDFKRSLYDISDSCCELCRGNQALSIHHIVPRSHGITIQTLTNCMVLCDKCHKPFALDEYAELRRIHADNVIDYCLKWHKVVNEKGTRLINK